MEKIRLLLYCCKQPHKLFNTDKGFVLSDFELGDFYKDKTLLNGKIVAECDYEVEEIEKFLCYEFGGIVREYKTKTLIFEELLKKSCLSNKELDNYLNGNVGYAIHVKNLNIFDKPKDLDYYVKDNGFTIEKTPQNMMYAYSWDFPIKVGNCYKREKYILISIRTEEMFRLLNGEQSILVRKKVLKEMVK